MKILFTADIHIKLGQKGVPIDWAKNRYNLLIAELARLQEDCHYFIIGGDIFDKVPSMEELEIYYELVSSIRIPCYIYPGNHEATKKGRTFFTSLKMVTKKLNNLVEVIDDFHTKLDPHIPHTAHIFDIIPYNKLKEFNPNDFSSRILFTHVRGEIPPHVKPEIDLELLNRWELVVAGDLHSYENSQKNILYPGSPITTSFHRNNVKTGVLIIDTDTLEHEWIVLKLPQLIRKTVQVGEPTPQTDFDHTVYEVEGDMSQLSDMENSDLIDRKVVRRSTDTALMLDTNMSIEEEMVEYLKYVLTLDDSSVEDILKEYNNHAEKL